MIIGNDNFETGKHTYVMGIINITPDSFSDGRANATLDDYLFLAEKLIDMGASVLDLGAESTRPGYTRISDQEEIDRLLPVLEELHRRFDVPLSVDTYKSEVAEAAIKSGCDLINDICGLKGDEKMAEVIGKAGIPCVLMYNGRLEAEENKNIPVVERIKKGLSESVRIAEKAGIATSNIILDPGIGFLSSTEEDLIVLKNLKDFHELKLPMLIGTSRKSVIGNTLNLNVKNRLEGTITTSVMAAQSGYSFVRVHDVLENRRAIDMYEAIMNVKG